MNVPFSEILDFLKEFLPTKLGDGGFSEFVLEILLKLYLVGMFLFAWSLKPLIWLQNLFQR
jgi:hypothetical protein